MLRFSSFAAILALMATSCKPRDYNAQGDVAGANNSYRYLRGATLVSKSVLNANQDVCHYLKVAGRFAGCRLVAATDVSIPEKTSFKIVSESHTCKPSTAAHPLDCEYKANLSKEDGTGAAVSLLCHTGADFLDQKARHQENATGETSEDQVEGCFSRNAKSKPTAPNDFNWSALGLNR